MTNLVYTQDNGLLAIVSGTLPASAPRGSDAITVEDVPSDMNFHAAWFIDGGHKWRFTSTQRRSYVQH